MEYSLTENWEKKTKSFKGRIAFEKKGTCRFNEVDFYKEKVTCDDRIVYIGHIDCET